MYHTSICQGLSADPSLSPVSPFPTVGGYISGEPLVGPFVFNLIRSSPIGTRVFGISYRLAQQPSTSFPAALQDALAAWSYLIHDRGFAPENITCAGDSAGGGLIWSLITYLGVLQTEGIKDLGLPGQVALFSVSPGRRSCPSRAMTRN